MQYKEPHIPTVVESKGPFINFFNRVKGTVEDKEYTDTFDTFIRKLIATGQCPKAEVESWRWRLAQWNNNKERHSVRGIK